MKKLLLVCCIFANSHNLIAQSKLDDTSYLQPVEILAIRAMDKTPVTKTNILKHDIIKRNIGQDLPYIFRQTPAIVASSDAGNGIGYTGLRLRGADASRINITLNGIPYNDAESQGAFLVNIPDIASSAGSIQIQRGVGTSTNGAGAFAGSINISTNEIVQKRSFELNNSYGSYQSLKNSLLFHSGIFAKNFSFDARLSNIRSDGYIDRASSDLKSFYSSLAFVSAKKSFRLNVFSGHEKTYQAWNGVDAQTLQDDRTYNSAGTEKPGDPYSNEVDNYTQTHYQLFYNQQINSKWKTNLAVFLTRGKGYYEQYKASESLADYGLPNYDDGDTLITETDLIRRLWLDNYYYGSIFSAHYSGKNNGIIIGAGINKYEGSHYGKIIDAAAKLAVPNNHRWYNNNADKSDASLFVKWNRNISAHWNSFADMQVRSIHYNIDGFRDNPEILINNAYTFFNPKLGITYSNKQLQWYISYGQSAKEPNRDDFEAGSQQLPKAEKLYDVESGITYKIKGGNIAANLYYMRYSDQLVLTGKINDVGAYTRTNIPNSYRMGLEIQATKKISELISVDANISFSSNKIKDFTEYIDDYDNGGQQTKFYENTDIAFSPSVVGAYTIDVFPTKKMNISLMGKYVSKQYLDNTSNNLRSLDAYYTQDARLGYQFKMNAIKSATAFFQVNNLFSKKYEPNGYSFSYLYAGELTTENYYFPMAPINWMIGLNIRL